MKDMLEILSKFSQIKTTHSWSWCLSNLNEEGINELILMSSIEFLSQPKEGQEREIDKARFWSKCKDIGSCWEWQGALNGSGYGSFRIKGKTENANRYAYKISKGDPGKFHVCHKCDNPKCVNPDHLFLGTNKDNMQDKAAKGRARHKIKSSEYLGVGLRSDRIKWTAYIFVNGKQKSLGSFDSELSAAAYRDRYIIQNKLNCTLNFIENAV